MDLRALLDIGALPLLFNATALQENVRDPCICRARDIHSYLAHLVMSSKVGERMGGIDFMTFSST